MNSAVAQSEIKANDLRTPIGDVMKYEILLNEKAQVWLFHDKALPGRLAWVEFDPATGRMDLIPHDMRAGILYADIPRYLQSKFQASGVVHFYQTADGTVTGFQKAPIHLRRHL